MAATLRAPNGTSSAWATATASSIIVTIPSGAVVGDLAVVCLSVHSTTATVSTTPSGWTLRASPSSTAKAWIYDKVLTAGDISGAPTWVFSAAVAYAWGIALFTGENTTTPYDPDSTWVSANVTTTSYSTTAYTTTVDGAMPLVVGGFALATAESGAAPANYSYAVNSGNGGNTSTRAAVVIGYMTAGQATAGSVAISTWTGVASGGAAWRALMAAATGTTVTADVTSDAAATAPVSGDVTSTAVAQAPASRDLGSSAVATVKASRDVTSSAVATVKASRDVTSSAVATALAIRDVTSTAVAQAPATRNVTSTAVATAPALRDVTSSAVATANITSDVTSSAAVSTNWTAGSLTLGSPAALSGGTVNVPGSGYASADATQIDATTGWMAISLKMPYAYNAMPTAYGMALNIRRPFSGSWDFSNYYQLTYGHTEQVWFGQKSGAASAQSALQTFAAGDNSVIVLAWDSGNVYLQVDAGSLASTSDTYVLTGIDSLFDFLEGWQGFNYLGDATGPGAAYWVAYGAGAVPSSADLSALVGFGTTAPAHDSASWPASRRFIWRNQDGTTTWITSTSAAATVTADVTSSAAAVQLATRDVTSSAVATRTLTRDVTSAAVATAPVSRDVTSSAVATRLITADVTSTAIDTRTLTRDVTSSAVANATLTRDVTSTAIDTRTLTRDVTSSAAATAIVTRDVTSAAVALAPATRDVTSTVVANATITRDVTSTAIDTRALTRDVTSSAAASETITRDTLSTAVALAPATRDVTSSATTTGPSTRDVASTAVALAPATRDVTSSAVDTRALSADVTSTAADTRALTRDVTSSTAVTAIVVRDVTNTAVALASATRDVGSSAVSTANAITRDVLSSAVALAPATRDVLSSAVTTRTIVASVSSTAADTITHTADVVSTAADVRTLTANVSSAAVALAPATRDVTASAVAGLIVARDVASSAVARAPATRDLLSSAVGITAAPAILRVYLGVTLDTVYQDAPTPFNFAPVDAWIAASGKAPAILHWYQAWAAWQSTPPSVAQLQSVAARGAVPLITWQPNGAAGVTYSLTDIAAGVYDSIIDAFATALANYGGPVLVRFAHEMNGSWYTWGDQGTNTPAQYIAAWQHVHDRVRAVAPNSQWVWCPNVNYVGEADFSLYYPGDAYVDWLGLDGYNWGAVSGQVWETFSTIFDGSYTTITALSSKPLMIAEFASSETGGDKAAWITDALGTRIPTTYPRIAAAVWFNFDQTGSSTPEDWRITSSEAARAAFAAAVAPTIYRSVWRAGDLVSNAVATRALTRDVSSTAHGGLAAQRDVTSTAAAQHIGTVAVGSSAASSVIVARSLTNSAATTTTNTRDVSSSAVVTITTGWNAGSLVLGGAAAVTGGVLSVPGSGYAQGDASQANMSVGWAAIALKHSWAATAAPNAYGSALLFRKPLAPTPDYGTYIQLVYEQSTKTWMSQKAIAGTGTPAQSITQTFAVNATQVIVAWWDGTTVSLKVGTQDPITVANSNLVTGIDTLFDLLQGWQTSDYLGSSTAPGQAYWAAYGSGAVPSTAEIAALISFGATAPVHDNAAWPVSRRFVWRQEDGTQTWITATDAQQAPHTDVTSTAVVTVTAAAVPVVLREILLDTQATDAARDGAYGANGGNSWGSMKQPIVRCRNGDIYVLVERLGPYNNNANNPDYWGKQWNLFRITPAMQTNVTTSLFDTIGPYAGPFTSGRERPNMILMPDDSLRVIGWHPNPTLSATGQPSPWQDTQNLEDEPYMWDSRTGVEVQLASTANMSRAFWDVRWPYSTVMVSGHDIWIIMNNQNQTVPDPNQGGALDQDYPGGYRIAHSPDDGATWEGGEFHYTFIRSLYPYMFPRLDLGRGGVEYFVMPASLWATFAAHSNFVNPNNGSTYMWNGLVYFRIPDVTASTSNLTFDYILSEPQWSPPDDPQYEICEAYKDSNGIIHIIMTGWGSFWGGPNIGGSDLVQIHPDPVTKLLPANPTVTRMNCPIIFANQARYFRGTDNVFWLIGGGSPYPVNSATQPNEIRYVQATPSDTDATQWRTYPNSPNYNGYSTFNFQIIPLSAAVGQSVYASQNGSDRFHIANPRNGSAEDPNNHVHCTFGAGGLAYYVEVALPTSTVSPTTHDVASTGVATAPGRADLSSSAVVSAAVVRDVTSSAVDTRALSRDETSTAAAVRTLIASVASTGVALAPATRDVTSASVSTARVTRDLGSSAVATAMLAHDVASTAAATATILRDVTSSAATVRTAAANVASSAVDTRALAADVTSSAVDTRLVAADVLSSAAETHAGVTDVASSAVATRAASADLASSAAGTATATRSITSSAVDTRALAADVTSSAVSTAPANRSVTTTAVVTVTGAATTADLLTSAAAILSRSGDVASAAVGARITITDLGASAAATITHSADVASAVVATTSLARDLGSSAVSVHTQSGDVLTAAVVRLTTVYELSSSAVTALALSGVVTSSAAVSATGIHELTTSAAATLAPADDLASTAVVRLTGAQDLASSAVAVLAFSSNVDTSAAVAVTVVADLSSSAVVEHQLLQDVSTSAAVARFLSGDVTSSAATAQQHTRDVVSTADALAPNHRDLGASGVALATVRASLSSSAVVILISSHIDMLGPTKLRVEPTRTRLTVDPSRTQLVVNDDH